MNRITIVGVGLIGGSLGMAIKRRKIAREVVGVVHHRSTIAAARRRRAIDCGTTSLALGVRQADIVVVATPPSVVPAMVRRMRPHLAPHAIVTDVASTKQQVVRTGEQILHGSHAFVGAHPIAGSEARGVQAAMADLFAKHLCIVTPTRATRRSALHCIRRLWTRAGARVVSASPRVHDEWSAMFSHVPHLLAFALASATPVNRLMRTPRSFLDVTRLAHSDPALWRDIATTNRPAILRALARVERQLRLFRRAIRQPEAGTLMRMLRRAQQRRLRNT